MGISYLRSNKIRESKKTEELHNLIESKVKPSEKGMDASSVREDRDRGH